MSRTDGPVAIQVDRIRCDGYGMCAELLPEMIDLDDWGYPILRPGPVPPDLLQLSKRAVDVCPVLALRLASVATARRPIGAAAPRSTSSQLRASSAHLGAPAAQPRSA
jgi:ferredoxin